MERASESWAAVQQDDVLTIRGVTRYPNDFSTAFLEQSHANRSGGKEVAFVLRFARDKEPYCGKDLLGSVYYQQAGHSLGLTSVMVVDGTAVIQIPVMPANNSLQPTALTGGG